MRPEDYPQAARAVGYEEIMTWVDAMLPAIHQFNPDQIVGVARSGMPFAAFISQKLGLDLGYYNPKYEQMLFAGSKPRRIVIVDENFVTGKTQAQIRNHMTQYPDIEYQLACVMLDHFCPDRNCIAGRLLDFWGTDMACFFKSCDSTQWGVRYRD